MRLLFSCHSTTAGSGPSSDCCPKSPGLRDLGVRAARALVVRAQPAPPAQLERPVAAGSVPAARVAHDRAPAVALPALPRVVAPALAAAPGEAPPVVADVARQDAARDPPAVVVRAARGRAAVPALAAVPGGAPRVVAGARQGAARDPPAVVVRAPRGRAVVPASALGQARAGPPAAADHPAAVPDVARDLAGASAQAPGFLAAEEAASASGLPDAQAAVAAQLVDAVRAEAVRPRAADHGHLRWAAWTDHQVVPCRAGTADRPCWVLPDEPQAVLRARDAARDRRPRWQGGPDFPSSERARAAR